MTDPRGIVRRANFNSDGHTTSETHALGLPEAQTSTYERASGTNFVAAVVDAFGRRTTAAFDAMGNPTSVTILAGTADAATTSMTYESAFNQLTSVTDPLSRTTTFSYDAKGSLTSATDPLSHQSTIVYNGAGQPASITDPLSNTVQVAYELGDVVSVTDPLNRITRPFIDNAGRLISLTNPAGEMSRSEYDALNRLTRMTDPLGNTTSFSYDPNGNLLTVTDARNNVTSYAYNNMDRVTTRTDPLLRAETYTYDANGDLSTATDRKSQATSFTYDGLGRSTQTSFADSSTTTFTYDAGNRLTQAVDSVSGTITLAYDTHDRLTSETTPEGAVSYTYDAVSRRTGMTVVGQSQVTYGYDNSDRLTGITQGTNTASYSYDDADRLTVLTLPNGVRQEYSYDNASQLAAIAYKLGTNTLGDLTYGYDGVGQRVSLSGSYARTGIPTAVASATHNANNEVTNWGGTALTYDNNGNLTSDGTNTYTWNARNHLASISGGVAASFRYDAFGRRRGKTVAGTNVDFLYDGVNPVQELSGGTPIANMITGLGIDQMLNRTDSAGARYPLTDALGSTLALTDVAGAAQTQYTYEPFGKTTASGPTSSSPYQYTGRENDGITGLYFYRGRYYSPTLQRFVSEDPIGFAGRDTNLYAYVGNNPTGLVDPLGLKPAQTMGGDGSLGALAAAELFRSRAGGSGALHLVRLQGAGSVLRGIVEAARGLLQRVGPLVPPVSRLSSPGPVQSYCGATWNAREWPHVLVMRHTTWWLGVRGRQTWRATYSLGSRLISIRRQTVYSSAGRASLGLVRRIAPCTLMHTTRK